MSKRFKRALKRARVREVRFHDLRHTRCAAAGVPLRTLQAWMGHADIKTTMVYTHYLPDANEAELVNRVFQPEGIKEGIKLSTTAHDAEPQNPDEIVFFSFHSQAPAAGERCPTRPDHIRPLEALPGRLPSSLLTVSESAPNDKLGPECPNCGEPWLRPTTVPGRYRCVYCLQRFELVSVCPNCGEHSTIVRMSSTAIVACNHCHGSMLRAV